MQRARRRSLATENEAPPIGLAHSEWCEIELFIQENVYCPEGEETLEDRFQKEYDSGYKIGQEDMFGNIKKKLLEIAAEHFKNGRDQEARSVRDLALKTLANEP